MSSSQLKSRVRFGVFELDVRAGELRKSGLKIKLQPQPLEVLLLLLERPGTVFTREELHQRLWQEGVFVDFDRSLNKAVVKLRESLGDDAESPRYIETLPRHGYRFIAPVQEINGSSLEVEAESLFSMPGQAGNSSREPGQAAEFMIEVKREGPHLKWGWPLALAGLAAIIVGLLWLRSLSPPSYSVHSYILPPEKATLSNYGPVVVSPDGRRMAFTANGTGGRPMLWVQPLSSATAQPLAGTEGASYPFWSADSRSLGFFAGGKLNTIDASGGPPRALCDAPLGRGGAWNQDGTIVFSLVMQGVMRVDASGGAPLPVTQLERDQISHRWPWFLPDGKHFFYFAMGTTRASDGIYVGSLGSRQQTLVLRNNSNGIYAEPGYLLFGRNGTLMAQRFNPHKLALEGDAASAADHVAIPGGFGLGIFTASANGLLIYQAGGLGVDSQLIWIDRSGKRGEPAIPGAAQYLDPALSPDGRKLAVTIADARDKGDIWVVDLARKTKTRITFGPGLSRFAVWWPDGKSIVFGSNRRGDDIYRKPADGTGREEKLVENSAWPTSVSPDGRYIAYSLLDANRRFGVWALPMFDDRKPFPLVSTPFNEFVPAISPDGKWVAYMSGESGQSEVYIKPFPTGEGKWQVSTSSGAQPEWRRDGKELFFITPDDAMMAVDVRESGAGVELGTPHELFRTNAVFGHGQTVPYSASADGQRFLINERTTEGTSEPFTLVTNWTAGLKK